METIQKNDSIEMLIRKAVAGEDLSKEKKILMFLSYFDIASYAKARKMRYSLDDIKQTPKADLINSIAKHKGQ